MKPTLAGFVLLASAALALAQKPEPLSVVLVTDISRSVAIPFAQSKAEQKQMIAVMPDGSDCIMLAVGSSVRRLFDGTLNPSRRAEAVRQIDLLQPTEWYTDLGAGLEEAIGSLFGLGGRRQIWIFTDGGNQPVRGSHYRGQTFQQVLNAAKLPAGVNLFVRLFGGREALSAPGLHCQIFRTPPDFAVIVRPFRPMPPAPVNVHPPAMHLTPWWIAAGVTSVGLLLLAAMLWRRHPSGEDDLTAPLDPEQPLVAPGPIERVHQWFAVRAAGVDRAGCVDPDGQEELLVGDSTLANVFLPKCDGGAVRFYVEGTPQEPRLFMENAGDTLVFVGKRKIEACQSQLLPSRNLEIRIGRQVLYVFPESAVITERAIERTMEGATHENR